MAILKKSGANTPLAIPIPAMINATSPRGTIPIPIRNAPIILKFANRAGNPHPTTLAMIASTVKIPPNARTFG